MRKIAKDSKNQHKNQSDLWGEFYTPIDEYRLSNWRTRYLRMLFQELEFQLGDKFLDIGVGVKRYTVIEAAGRGISAVGIDVSPIVMIKALKFATGAVLGNCHQFCSFICGDAECLPFPDNSFSKVCSIGTIQYVTNDRKVFDEIARVTRCGGGYYVHHRA